MKIIAIVVTDSEYGEFGPRRERARMLRESVGIHAENFYGLHAARLGLESNRLYILDGPPGARLSPKNVGTWISHRALWAACLLLPDTEFLLLEDDALFPQDWAVRLAEVLRHVPEDWDLINLGACCATDKPREHVAGPLYTVTGGPMCLHAYIVQRRALPILIWSQDAAGCAAPIDISVLSHSYSALRVYTVLPRIVDQLDLDTLPP
jgi:GR25 family glycosyltransferase involved in LPS biosynthesis